MNKRFFSPFITWRRPSTIIMMIMMIITIWLAFALRLFALGEQSLWYDEGVTWYLTQFDLPALVRWTAADIQPPFYYLVMWLTSRLMGQSEWALRFPSVFFGLLGVPMLWQLGHYLFDRPRTRPQGPGHYWGTYWGPYWGGNLAAWLMVISPLMVYYSQEARMYTLLVFQASLASYLVLRISDSRDHRRPVGAYILVMASALYTHYFAAFLLLAHALYLASLLLKTGPLKTDQPDPPAAGATMDRARLLKQSLTMFLGVSLLFAPWLSVLVARLGDDPSYWPGVLKLNEVVQDVFISFAVGGKREMIFEADGLPLAAGFGGLLLISLVSILWRARKIYAARSQIIFLLLWLVIPIAMILGLSYQTPKFNPRYTMLSWPAFALILAWGGVLSKGRDRFQFAGPELLGRIRGRRYGSGLLLGLAALFILFSSGFSLRNWFFRAEFSRDDYKAVAQFIRERSFHNEPVLLSSGHFFPVWLYYFGPDNWTPLPQMETLDVNRVADFEIAPQIAQAITGQPGVWLVTWQDEVVDPNGIVPFLLDMVGERSTDPLLIGDFWGVDLKYWHLPAQIDFQAHFQARLPAGFNFGNLVRLHGFQPEGGANTTGVLLWEALQPLKQDYLLSLRLVDAANIPWSEETVVARPGAYLYPTQRWPPGKIIAGRQRLPWLPGTPPGAYWLEVGWLEPDGQGVDVLDHNGNPVRRTVRLGPIQLTEPITGLQSLADRAVKMETVRDFGPVNLLSDAFAVEAVEAGSKVQLETIWQVKPGGENRSPVKTITFAFWQDSQGNRWPLAKPVSLPLDAIPAGVVFRSREQVTTPHQANAGPVTLHARMIGVDGATQTQPVSRLTLRPTERVFAQPTNLPLVVAANFANLGILLGAAPDPIRLSPGQSATLTLYWRAEAIFAADYTIFAHVLGPEGTPLLNFDHAPPRPTSNWFEGEVIADPITLTIPADFPAGHYPLEVGLYNTADPNLARLPLVDPAGPETDYVILTDIEVVAP